MTMTMTMAMTMTKTMTKSSYDDKDETMTMTKTVATFLSFLLSLLFGALLRLFSDLRNHSFLHLYILFYGI